MAVLALCLSAAGAGAAIVFFRSSGMDRKKKKGTRAPQATYLEELSARVAAVEVKVNALPSLWEEERERSKKQADRASQAVRDLEARLIRDEGDPDDEGEGDELRDEHAVRRQGEQLQLMPEGLGQRASNGVEERAAEALRMFGRR